MTGPCLHFFVTPRLPDFYLLILILMATTHLSYRKYYSGFICESSQYWHYWTKFTIDHNIFVMILKLSFGSDVHKM